MLKVAPCFKQGSSNYHLTSNPHDGAVFRILKGSDRMNWLTSIFKSGAAYEEFCTAMANGDLGKVKVMLKKNKKMIHEKDDKGMTPLHMAATLNRLEVAAVLIELGADVNVQNNKGVTPLQCAAAVGYKKMADFLKKHGAK
jgi:ankyrin repeat protein